MKLHNLNLIHSQELPVELSRPAIHDSLSRAEIARESVWEELGNPTFASSEWRHEISTEIMKILD
jgi:hypothetical protein